MMILDTGLLFGPPCIVIVIAAYGCINVDNCDAAKKKWCRKT